MGLGSNPILAPLLVVYPWKSQLSSLRCYFPVLANTGVLRTERDNIHVNTQTLLYSCPPFDYTAHLLFSSSVKNPRVNSVTLVSSILFLSFSSPFLFFQSLFSFSTPCSLLFRYIQSFQELLRLLHVLHHKLYLTRVFVLVVRLPFYSISQKTDNFSGISLSKTD